MILTGENQELGEKPVPVPLCSPQTRPSVVKGRRRTARVMARPCGPLEGTIPEFSWKTEDNYAKP
jgi:hypothetical protein